VSDSSLEHAIASVASLYTESLSKHGIDSQAVGWKDEASQLFRFDQLARVIDDGDEPISVNDWGCGFGAMFDYLDRRLGARLASYTGYDISPKMIGAARSAVDDERASFVLGSSPQAADYTFVSGTFNVRQQASEDDWRAWVEERLRELAAASHRGFAFNLLSTYVDWKEDHLFYGDPRGFFDFCKRELSSRVALLHDYPLYEWTILVRLGAGA
jgi:SAM-dependent methyltransferase